VVHISTTHTPDYMHLPGGAWATSGGVANAGEGVVIGVVDTGIYPDHPSFADDPVKPYAPLSTFKSACGTDPRVPNGFCNGKIVGAQHFFAAAMAADPVNATDPDLSSPLDGNGHGS
jgi:subtilisin family serine protease